MPITSDIIALLSHQGDPQAAGALRQGDIAAQEAARKQALWASIIGTGINVATNLPGQIAQMRDARALADERRARAQALQQDMAGRAALGQTLHDMTDPQTGHADPQKVADALSAKGYPQVANAWLKANTENAESIDKLRKMEEDRAKAQLGLVGDLAWSAGDDPDKFAAGLGILADHKVIDPQTALKFGELTQSDDWKKLRDKVLPLSPKWQAEQAKSAEPFTLKAGETRFQGGQPVASGGPEPVKNEAELAADAANPQSPTAPRSKAALDLLKQQKNPPTLEEQLLTAITNGDNATAARIRTTLKMKAEASKDPAQIAMANELAGLRKQEAQARLDKLREENAPIDVANNTFTTSSGRKYVDLSEFQTPSAREKARKSADDAGLMVVNKEGAQSLQAADTARANLSALYAQIEPYLPKDASGRLVGGPKNKLEKIFQTNPTLGAFGSWRTAAIQAVQALAERGMGLRLNKAEIDLMLQNDIPQITDDAPTAKQRIDNVFKLLDNKEKTLLERDRSSGAGTGDADLVKRLNERRKSGG